MSMEKKDILFLVIPAYNEEANIINTVEQWYPIVEAHDGNDQSRLVVVDDGSRDNTLALLQNEASCKPLMIILAKQNGGHGDAVLHGYRYAIEHGADYIFQTDSDGQTNPDEFEAFWKERANYTGIFGDRSDRQDGAGRIFVENTLLFFLRMIFRVRIPDSNAPFRLMKTECVGKYIKLLPEHYSLPNVMLTVFFAYYGEPIRFRYITFKPRQGGENSINIIKICKIGWQSVKDFYKIRRRMPKK